MQKEKAEWLGREGNQQDKEKRQADERQLKWSETVTRFEWRPITLAQSNTTADWPVDFGGSWWQKERAKKGKEQSSVGKVRTTLGSALSATCSFERPLTAEN